MKTYKYTSVSNTVIEEFDTTTLQFRFIPVDLLNADYVVLSGSGVLISNADPESPIVVISGSDLLHVVMKGGSLETWTNMPAAATFFGGSAGIVQNMNISDKTEARMIHVRGSSAGSANARLFLRHSPTFSTTATAYTGMGGLDPTFGTPFVTASSVNYVEDSGWQPLIPAARAEVYIAVVGSGGNGAADPSFGSIVALFR